MISLNVFPGPVSGDVISVAGRYLKFHGEVSGVDTLPVFEAQRFNILDSEYRFLAAAVLLCVATAGQRGRVLVPIDTEVFAERDGSGLVFGYRKQKGHDADASPLHVHPEQQVKDINLTHFCGLAVSYLGLGIGPSAVLRGVTLVIVYAVDGVVFWAGAKGLDEQFRIGAPLITDENSTSPIPWESAIFWVMTSLDHGPESLDKDAAVFIIHDFSLFVADLVIISDKKFKLLNSLLVVFAPPQAHTHKHKLCCGGKNTTTHHTPPFRGCVCVVVSKQQNVKMVKSASFGFIFARRFLQIGAS